MNNKRIQFGNIILHILNLNLTKMLIRTAEVCYFYKLLCIAKRILIANNAKIRHDANNYIQTYETVKHLKTVELEAEFKEWLKSNR